MAWSPFQRANAGIIWVQQPGDYANPIPTTSATGPRFEEVSLSDWLAHSPIDMVDETLNIDLSLLAADSKEPARPRPGLRVLAYRGNCETANRWNCRKYFCARETTAARADFLVELRSVELV